MRTLPLALAAASLLACARTGPPLVIEESTPIVAADGTTTESLGIAAQYGEFIELIPRGAKVPCSKVQTIATAHRGFDRIEFAVFRGTATDTRDDTPLGVFGAPKPKNAAGRFGPVEVTFAIGADRRISLAAKDPASGKPVTLERVR